jgi:hypothetical protein
MRKEVNNMKYLVIGSEGPGVASPEETVAVLESTIGLRLPDSLHDKVRELAERENASINQLVTLALAEKISALMTEEYLSERAKRGSKEEFEKAMARVADIATEEQDRI